MHKLAQRHAVARASKRASTRDVRGTRPHLSATHVVRAATTADVGEIHELVVANATRGLVLPRTAADIAAAIDDYVVVADSNGRVQAAAAIIEYSPSLAEVGSVVVDAAAQGRGLGTIAVRGVESFARRRGYDELFALTKADRFFESLGYTRTAVDRYPEKLARYEALAAQGVAIVPKSCYRKLTAAG